MCNCRRKDNCKKSKREGKRLQRGTPGAKKTVAAVVVAPISGASKSTTPWLTLHGIVLFLCGWIDHRHRLARTGLKPLPIAVVLENARLCLNHRVYVLTGHAEASKGCSTTTCALAKLAEAQSGCEVLSRDGRSSHCSDCQVEHAQTLQVQSNDVLDRRVLYWRHPHRCKHVAWFQGSRLKLTAAVIPDCSARWPACLFS